MFSGKYYGMDHDQYEDTVTNECIQSDQSDTQQQMDSEGDGYRQNEQLRRQQQSVNAVPLSPSLSRVNGGRGLSGTGTSAGQIFESQATYNPFDIHMGQMTVYRLRITCSCSSPDVKEHVAPEKTPGKKNVKSQMRCAKILPFEDQPWTGYMGSHADSYFSLSANPYPHKIFSTLPSSVPSSSSSSSGTPSSSIFSKSSSATGNSNSINNPSSTLTKTR